MTHVAGWAGHPAQDAGEAAAYLAARASGHGAAGSGWACRGPHVATGDGLSVVVRGEPTWRTGEAAIRSAANPAAAIHAAFQRHGKSLLQSLYGSFAFAAIDQKSGATLLAVDRMGIERLTYQVRDRSLIFATSAEFVARFPGLTPRIDLQAVLSYLFFHMIPAPQTVFAGVRKIPAATAIEWQDGTLREFTYWQPQFAPEGSGSFPELKAGLHSSLEQAVREARPDARSGAFLSGGLDSSTVAGYLAKVGPPPARTFSMGFGFEQYDELSYARIANQRFGCEPHEYVVTPEDIVDAIPRVSQAYDEPFGNASAIPTYCCARLALQHGVSHLLAGDGGDEIFAGNKRYAEQLVFERYGNVPALLRTGLLEPILGNLPAPLQVSVLRKGRNYIAQAKMPLPDRFENWNFLHRLGHATMLHPDFIAATVPDGPQQHMRAVYSSAPPCEAVDRMLYYDWRFTLADNDLRKVGTMCDLAGVRVSYPMLHQDVIDLSTRVPAGMKMRGTQLRSFYKEAMMDFLPHEIINKSKHGFGLPFGLWLQRSQSLAELIDGNLEGLRARNIIHPQFVDRLRSLHGQEDAAYYGVLIWTLAMLEQWFRDHGVGP